MTFAISVRNCQDDKLRFLIKDSARFYLGVLMPRRRKTIRVIVTLVQDLLEKEVLWADTEEVDECEFSIRLQDCPDLDKMLTTLAHECVHVKQFARGELRSDSDVWIWEGKKIKETISYWDFPWEIEAHGRERGLFVRWKESKEEDIEIERTHQDGQPGRSGALQV